VAGKDLRDQPASLLGQRHDDEPAIVTTTLLLDQAATDEVAHHDGGIAVAAQQLFTEIALAQRPVMQQRLQHAELSDGEAGRRHHAPHPRGHRLGGPHELDVGVEGRSLLRAAAIVGRHALNLNRCLSLHRKVVKAHCVLATSWLDEKGVDRALGACTYSSRFEDVNRPAQGGHDVPGSGFRTTFPGPL